MKHLPPATIIDSDEKLAAVIDNLLRQPAVAVDTEANSLHAYYERVCLIQLSTPEVDLIVDPLADVDVTPLGQLFASESVQKVLHAAEQDVAGMKRDMGFEFVNLFDTMWAARILGWPRVGLADVLREQFGVQLNKRYQRYDWGTRPLPPETLDYARMDTRYLLPLRDLQIERLRQKGRLEEATEVFAQMADTLPIAPSFGPEAFWRVKGSSELEGRERAVLWELYNWRDQVASQRDRPPFKIVGDLTLVHLAHTQPHSLKELRQTPGLAAYLVERHGQALLQAIARGEQGPIPEPPNRHTQPKESVMKRYRALRAWRRQVAAELGVDNDVVFSNTVVWELAVQNPTTPEALGTIAGLGPWKQRIYGPEVLDVLRSCQ